jgi:hypothetical protein
MQLTDKKQHAVDFINGIRTMDPGDLNALIVRTAGEDLAEFFLNYSANLISKDPGRILENCSALMLMGYLIRDAQQADPLFVQEPGATQPPAVA